MSKPRGSAAGTCEHHRPLTVGPAVRDGIGHCSQKLRAKCALISYYAAHKRLLELETANQAQADTRTMLRRGGVHLGQCHEHGWSCAGVLKLATIVEPAKCREQSDGSLPNANRSARGGGF